MTTKSKDRTDHQWRNSRVRGTERDKILGLRELGIPVRCITPFQYRVGALLDLYPTNRRYHNLKTGVRGTYKNIVSIVLQEARCQPVLKKTPVTEEDLR